METNRIEVQSSELSVYVGEKHVPPAPRLVVGDTVEFDSHCGKRMCGTFLGFNQHGLATVRLLKYLFYHVRPNRLTVTEVSDGRIHH